MIKNKWTGEEFPVNKCNFAQSGTGQFNSGGSILNSTDYAYHQLIEKILEEGLWKQNRTGIKTLSVFGPQVEFPLVGNMFPLISTKRVHLKSIIGELLWFLSGSTNKFELRDKYDTTIWDEWGNDETGELGPVYGHQWVNWEYLSIQGLAHYGIDANKVREPLCDGLLYGQRHIKKSINQLQNIIDTLKTNPDDRRMIVSAWHVDQIPEMALPPCHWSYQFYTSEIPRKKRIELYRDEYAPGMEIKDDHWTDSKLKTRNIPTRKLDIKMNIRSWDIFLGGPFNIASYAILLMMMAQEVDMLPGNLYISAGDVHIYENHFEYIFKQLSRSSKEAPPIMLLNENKGFWDFAPEDFELKGYDPHPNWKNIPVAV
jgi:thymidylate synthase